jgi:hypothetical protein
LLVFKLFPIGYGPTPSKKKNIELEKKVVKDFELVLYRKKGENPFERWSFSLQNEWEFIFQVVAYKELTTFPSE